VWVKENDILFSTFAPLCGARCLNFGKNRGILKTIGEEILLALFFTFDFINKILVNENKKF